MVKDLSLIVRKNCKLGLRSAPVTGIARLGQRVLIELLTEEGSMRYLPERGCSFLPRIRDGALTEADVMLAFMVARVQIIKSFRRDIRKETPVDERLADVVLEDIMLYDNKLRLSFVVKSRDGSAVHVYTPFLSVFVLDSEVL